KVAVERARGAWNARSRVPRKPMHDTPDQVHWHEPKAGENAGYGKFKRAPMPYARFMEAEGVPVYRGIGVRRVQDLPLASWKRLGGRGSYIQLFGTEGLWGLYLVEIPSAGALNVERHLYEKVVLVVEGRGTTEVWQEGQGKRHGFGWQNGSLSSLPLNAYHRLVNAASVPALLLCGTSAPNVMNVIDNTDFVFNCPYTFSERFAGAEDFFKPRDDIEPDPIRGLAMRRTNLIPDIVNTAPPRAQQTAAGLAPAGSSRSWPATASICGSASTRPAAIPRRTSTPRPRCWSASRARATPIPGRRRSAPRRGGTARPTRCCART